MDSEGTSLEPQPVSESEPLPETLPVNQEELRRRQMAVAGLVVGVILLLALLVTAVIYLALPDTNTERIRDIMIIIMALEFMFLGIALMVLIVQLATLINLLQNEIIPIVESTNETANTLRGTTEFLSENLTEPVIKLNQYFAGFTRLIELIGLTRKR
ncbi:MAG: hypothetical protein JSW42_05515 [Chloroflexota bacterium]|nr:MAG: hypothetical protein JSW42_05515 [Chloroflexota bacterium]